MKRKLLVPIVVILSIVIGSSGTYLYMRNKPGSQNSVLAAKQEVSTILRQVGKIIDLPTNESPTVATVSDVGKLKGQEFFKKAKNGDKVLIYTNNRKAILYRPSQNRIIEVAPISLQNNQVSPTPIGISNAVSPKPTITIQAPIRKVITPIVTNSPSPTIKLP